MSATGRRQASSTRWWSRNGARPSSDAAMLARSSFAQEVVGQVARRGRGRAARRSSVAGTLDRRRRRAGLTSGPPGRDQRASRARDMHPVHARCRTAAGASRLLEEAAQQIAQPWCCPPTRRATGAVAARARRTGGRQAPEARRERAAEIGRVAGEQLVAALADQDDLHVARARSARAERWARAPGRRAARRACAPGTGTPSRKRSGVMVSVRWRVPSARAASAAYSRSSKPGTSKPRAKVASSSTCGRGERGDRRSSRGRRRGTRRAGRRS